MSRRGSSGGTGNADDSGSSNSNSNSSKQGNNSMSSMSSRHAGTGHSPPTGSSAAAPPGSPVSAVPAGVAAAFAAEEAISPASPLRSTATEALLDSSRRRGGGGGDTAGPPWAHEGTGRRGSGGSVRSLRGSAPVSPAVKYAAAGPAADADAAKDATTDKRHRKSWAAGMKDAIAGSFRRNSVQALTPAALAEAGSESAAGAGTASGTGPGAAGAGAGAGATLFLRTRGGDGQHAAPSADHQKGGFSALTDVDTQGAAIELAPEEHDAKEGAPHQHKTPTAKSMAEAKILLDKLKHTAKKSTQLTKTQRVKCLLSPISPFMRRWDTVTLFALLTVAIVTPFELAFLDPAPDDGIFILNRVLDVLFLSDMLFTFFLQYRDKETLLWVYDLKLIALRYLKSWFLIDLLSVIPFDLASLMMGSDAVQGLQLVRVLRVAKLVKLARILRLMRISARWERDMSIPYSTVALIKFAVYMITMTHWFACLWGLFGVIQTQSAEDEGGATIDTSWLQFYGVQEAPVFELYLIGVHWAMQTVSTVGYGDYRATTTAERLLCCFCMAYGASVWAYVVASVCGIVTSMDPHGTQRKHQITEVNEFIQSKRLGKSWRPRLRGYFVAREQYQRTGAHQSLLRLMSPLLKAEVCYFINSRWIGKIRYLQDIPKQLTADIAMMLQQRFYAPEEMIDGSTLHILERGLCMQMGRVLPVGYVWGEDMIIRDARLRKKDGVYTLTHTHVHRLEREVLMHVLSYYPEHKMKVIGHSNWLSVKRRILGIVHEVKKAGEPIGFGFSRRLGLFDQYVAQTFASSRRISASVFTETAASAASAVSAAAAAAAAGAGASAPPSTASIMELGEDEADQQQ